MTRYAPMSGMKSNISLIVKSVNPISYTEVLTVEIAIKNDQIINTNPAATDSFSKSISYIHFDYSVDETPQVTSNTRAHMFDETNSPFLIRICNLLSWTSY
jgi:hypothetical protein